MLIKKEVIKVSLEITGVTCDICGSDCCKPNDTEKESPEYMTLKANWGYGSDKDCQVWTAQVCEDCVDKHFKMVKFQVFDPEAGLEEEIDEDEILSQFNNAIQNKDYETVSDLLDLMTLYFSDRKIVSEAREMFNKTFKTYPKGGVDDIELDFGEGEYNNFFLSGFYAYLQQSSFEKANSILTAYEQEHPDDLRVIEARETFNQLIN